MGGSGRQSLTKMAAFIADCDIFQIEITKSYSVENWREDVKALLTKTGVEQKPTVFLITDTQVCARFLPCLRACFQRRRRRWRWRWRWRLLALFLPPPLSRFPLTIHIILLTLLSPPPTPFALVWQLVHETFLEDLNNLLNAGDVPGIWAPDEYEGIIDAVRPAAQVRGGGGEGVGKEVLSSVSLP